MLSLNGPCFLKLNTVYKNDLLPLLHLLGTLGSLFFPVTHLELKSKLDLFCLRELVEHDREGWKQPVSG